MFLCLAGCGVADCELVDWAIDEAACVKNMAQVRDKIVVSDFGIILSQEYIFALSPQDLVRESGFGRHGRQSSRGGLAGGILPRSVFG
jgi:hypothetical protein